MEKEIVKKMGKSPEYFGTGIKVAAGFDLGTAAPLDTRTVCKTIQSRDALVSKYEGMIVYVEEDKTYYKFVDGAFKVLVPEVEVVDNLTTDDGKKPLSAKQGKVLKDKLDAHEGNADVHITTEEREKIKNTYTKSEVYAKGETFSKSEVTGALALKADANNVYDKATMDGKLKLKADQATVTEALELKADQATVTEELNKKATKEEVALKASKEELTNGLALKADTATMTQKLAEKAEKVHKHAHTDITGLGTVVTKNVGTAEGNVPVLGAGGKLDSSILPSIAINEYFTATNKETAMQQTVQNGDIISLTEESEGITYITVNASARTFEERFRPLTSVTDVVSKGELDKLLQQKADKNQVASDIQAAKQFATSEAQKEAGKVNTALTEAKGELEGQLTSANEKITALEAKDKTNSATIAQHTQKITALEAKDREIEGTVGGHATKIQKLEESVNGLKGIIEHTEEFTATNAQKVFTVTNTITDAEKVKVFVNGLKALKKEYTVDKAQKTITWKPEVALYEMGQGFLVEIVYC